MIKLDQNVHGVIMHVKAQSGRRQNGIRGIHDGALKVAVTQVPEKGKANKAILALLADQLGLRKDQIQLISGETASTKRFLIRGVTAADLEERIEALLRQD